jgi:hypothetical protein
MIENMEDHETAEGEHDDGDGSAQDDVAGVYGDIFEGV